VTQLFRRGNPDSAVEGERELLRRTREIASLELDAMKQELAARILAVKERESELEAALARSRRMTEGPPAEEIPRSTTVAGSEVDQVELRIAELREAERQFLRTREELAARSEALAGRERLVAERERQLAASGRGVEPSLVEPTRPRPFEPPASGSSNDQGFASGLESLRRRGTRRLAP
jgi:hypothetical protein